MSSSIGSPAMISAVRALNSLSRECTVRVLAKYKVESTPRPKAFSRALSCLSQPDSAMKIKVCRSLMPMPSSVMVRLSWFTVMWIALAWARRAFCNSSPSIEPWLNAWRRLAMRLCWLVLRRRVLMR